MYHSDEERSPHKQDELNPNMSERSDNEGEIQEKNEAKESNHAKCILELAYNKFKWNIKEDFDRFHRPDIQV